MKLKHSVSIFIILLFICSLFGQAQILDFHKKLYSELEYSAWKKQISGKNSNIYARELELVSENGYVSCSVDESSGEFNVGCDPTGSGSYQTLTYSYPGGDGTGWQLYYIDGGEHKTGSFSSDSSYIASDSSVVIVWNNYEGVHIRQTLKAVSLGTERGENEQVMFKTVISVADGICHDVGCMVYFDTMLDGDDAAEIATSYGYTGNASIFYTPDIPVLWRAYEDAYPPPEGNLEALGLLNSYGATAPDVFWYGNWSSSRGLGWNNTGWDLLTGLPYGDSATMVKWNSRTLCPGETATFITYYGLGSIDSSIYLEHTPPTLTIDDLEAPIELISYVVNGRTESACSVEVDIILPEGITADSEAPLSFDMIAGFGGTVMAPFDIIISPSVYGTTQSYIIQVDYENCSEGSSGTFSDTFDIVIPVVASDSCTISLTTDPEGGTTFIDDDPLFRKTVPCGDSVSISCEDSFTIALGTFNFIQWNDGILTETRSVIVNSDISFVAEYEAVSTIDSFTISLATEPEGGTTYINETASFSNSFEDGTEITISSDSTFVLLGVTYLFSGWSDGSSVLTRTLTITEDIFLTASYDAIFDDDCEHICEVNMASDNVDIVFVIDTTGSMSEFIDEVLPNLDDFASDISDAGYNFNFGLVTFGDGYNIWDTSPASGYQMTYSLEELQTKLAVTSSSGGQDGPETSLDAIYAGINDYQWRTDAEHIIIHITDAGFCSYDLPSGATCCCDSATSVYIEDLVTSATTSGIKIFSIYPDDLSFIYSNIYDSLATISNGEYYSAGLEDIETALADIASSLGNNVFVNFNFTNEYDDTLGITATLLDVDPCLIPLTPLDVTIASIPPGETRLLSWTLSDDDCEDFDDYYLIYYETTTGCTDTLPEEPTYTLTLYTEPEGAETYINETPASSGEFEMDDIVTISTEPVFTYTGTVYGFSHWSDDDSNLVRDIVITGDMSYTAYYTTAVDSYTITLSTLPSGGETYINSVPTYGGRYPEGSFITISTEATFGIDDLRYRFHNWSDGSTSRTRLIEVTGDTSFAALYEIDDCILDARLRVLSSTVCRGAFIEFFADESIIDTSETALYTLKKPDMTSIVNDSELNHWSYICDQSGVYKLYITNGSCYDSAEVYITMKDVQIDSLDINYVLYGCSGCFEIPYTTENCTSIPLFGSAELVYSVPTSFDYLAGNTFCVSSVTTEKTYRIYSSCGDCSIFSDSVDITIEPAYLSATLRDTTLCAGDRLPNLLDPLDVTVTPDGYDGEIFCTAYFIEDEDTISLFGESAVSSFTFVSFGYTPSSQGTLVYSLRLENSFDCTYDISTEIEYNRPSAVLSLTPEIACSNSETEIVLDASESVFICDDDLCYTYYIISGDSFIPIETATGCGEDYSSVNYSDIFTYGTVTFAVVVSSEYGIVADTAYTELEICRADIPIVSISPDCDEYVFPGQELTLSCINHEEYENIIWKNGTRILGTGISTSITISDTMPSYSVCLLGISCESACTTEYCHTFYIIEVGDTSINAYEDEMLSFNVDDYIRTRLSTFGISSYTYTSSDDSSGITIEDEMISWNCPNNCNVPSSVVTLHITAEHDCYSSFNMDININIVNTYSGYEGIDSAFGTSCIDEFIYNISEDTLTIDCSEGNCHTVSLELSADDERQCDCGWSKSDDSPFWFFINDRSGIITFDHSDIPEATYYAMVYHSDCTARDSIVLALDIPNHVPEYSHSGRFFSIPDNYDTLIFDMAEVYDVDGDEVFLDIWNISDRDHYVQVHDTEGRIVLRAVEGYSNTHTTPDTLYVSVYDEEGNYTDFNFLLSVYDEDAIETELPSLPIQNGISSIKPNPFNSNVELEINVEQSSNITLEICNIEGKVIKSIQNGQLEKGIYAYHWNGLDDKENQMPSGVYFVRMISTDKNSTTSETNIKRIILIR